ncbi:RHS repeat-associated core domain-containing protein [Pseudomonas vlassakiae]|nr:RHS repeat-associated core domain-containing protein [Pseudomonas vlassakiae]
MSIETSIRSDLHRSYSPYGAFSPVGGPWQSFAGAHLDHISGCYLLGNGRRAYNPTLMRLCSSDRLSPFDKGGRNSYAYCAGDPVNRVDPSGEASLAIKGKKVSIIKQSSVPDQSITAGDAVGYAVQALYAGNGVLGVTNTIVRGMEAVQGGNQSAVARGAMIGDFWGYGLSLGTRVTTVSEMLQSPAALSPVPPSSLFAMASGTGSTLSYAELPGRIGQLWRSSDSTLDFLMLAVRGTARASGFDLAGNAVARVGSPLLSTARVIGRSIASIAQGREVVITIRTRPRPSDAQDTRL